MSKPSDNYVMVNGAKIERQYFEENVKEAKQVNWVKETLSIDSDHGHCIICSIALPTEDSNIVYRSDHRLLCTYCYEHFVK